MSLVNIFVNAFKKASTPKKPDALEHARNDAYLGSAPPDSAGAFNPLRPAPESGDQDISPLGGADTGVVADISGGGGGGGNTQPPPGGGGKPPVKAPDGPESPSDPSPGGDDSPDPTPPSGPFDPGGVIFRTGGGDANLNTGGVNPLVISRDRALGAAEDPDAGGEVARPRAPLEVKGENAGILEDPDAGGEVAAARGSFDAIDKGMKEAGEKADIAIAEDPDAGGEVTTGGGSAGIGIPEGHVPGGGSAGIGIPEGHVPGGGSAGIGIPEGHVPGGGSAGIGIPEGHVPGGEQAAGSNLGIDLPLAEGADQMVSAEPDPEPRRGNLVLEEEPEGGSSPGDGDGPRLVPGGQDPDGGDPEGEEILVPLGDRRGSQVGDLRDPEQIADSLADRLRGRLDSGLTGGFKLEGEYKVEGIGPALASSDPEEGGEVFNKVKFKIEPLDRKFGEYKVEPDIKPEGDWKAAGGIKFEGGARDEPFNLKLEEVFETPASPAGPQGVPIPYPLADDTGDDLGDALARKAGEGQKEFLEAKLEDVLVTSYREGHDAPDSPDPGDDGLTGALARKAGGGQQDFFKVEMEDVLVTSARAVNESEADDGTSGTDWRMKMPGKGGKRVEEQAVEASANEVPPTEGTSAAVDGESSTKDHTGEIAFGRRTEVKDANDRYANVESRAADDDIEDDFESSSLLDLKAEPAAKEMLPGLAGELPDDADIEFDLDDADDVDESEL